MRSFNDSVIYFIVVDAEGRGIAAYHGYWARDFKRLDPHLLSDPADERVFASKTTIVDRLSAALHGWS